MQIRERALEDMPAVKALLTEGGLPADGLESARGWVAIADGQMVGHVAMEELGASAVLRSLVVAPEARGRGIARSLFCHAERQSVGKAIYLRTRTINAWVERRGYRTIGLNQVPSELKASPEFGGNICTSVPIYTRGAQQ